MSYVLNENDLPPCHTDYDTRQGYYAQNIMISTDLQRQYD